MINVARSHNIHQLLNEWLENEVNESLSIDQSINDHTLHIDKKVLVKIYWNELSIEVCNHLANYSQRDDTEVIVPSLYSFVFAIGHILSVPMNIDYLEKDNKYIVNIQFPNNYKANVHVSIQQIYDYNKVYRSTWLLKDRKSQLSIGQYLLIPHNYSDSELLVPCRIEKIEYHDNQIISIDVTENLEIINSNGIDLFTDVLSLTTTSATKSAHTIKLLQNSSKMNPNGMLLLYPTYKSHFYPISIQLVLEHIISQKNSCIDSILSNQQSIERLAEQIKIVMNTLTLSMQALTSELSAALASLLTNTTSNTATTNDNVNTTTHTSGGGGEMGLLTRDNLQRYSASVASSQHSNMYPCSKIHNKRDYLQEALLALRYRNLSHSLHNLIFIMIYYQKLLSFSYRSNREVIKSIASSLSAALSTLLAEQMIPLIKSLPVPYRISITDWLATSQCLRQVITAYKKYLFGTMVQVQYMSRGDRDNQEEYAHDLPNHYLNSSNINSKKNNNSAHVISDLVLLYHQYQQCSYQSIIEFYQLSMCDAIIRMDWHSTSPYLRNRKITYGTVSIITSIRQLIWNIYHSNNHSYNTIQIVDHSVDESMDLSNAFRDGLNVLFNSLVPLMYTYFSLSPSRIRLWQWNIDHYYILFMTIDTLLWMLNQERIKYQQNNQNSNNHHQISNNIKSFKEMFDKGSLIYLKEIEILDEVLILLTNMIFYLYLINNSIEDALELLSSQARNDSIVNDNINGVDYLNSLLQCFSWHSLFQSKYQLIIDINKDNNQLLNTISNKVLYEIIEQEVNNYDIFKDVLSYQGYTLSKFHFHFINNLDESVQLNSNNVNSNNNNNNDNNHNNHISDDDNYIKEYIFKELVNTKIINNKLPLNYYHKLKYACNNTNNNNSNNNKDDYYRKFLLIDIDDNQKVDVDVINKYAINCLNKRYELIPDIYPILSSIEIENVHKVKHFIDAII